MIEIPRHLPDQEIINVTSGSPSSRRARILSNFSPRPFMLAGQEFANVEAFVQCIKYPEADEERSAIAEMSGGMAKKHSPPLSPEIIEWQGSKIPYRSTEHYQLEAAAIFAKFDQNDEALEALLATGDVPLTHDTGTPETPYTCLPAEVFVQILDETRRYYFAEMGAADVQEALYVTSEVIAYARK